MSFMLRSFQHIATIHGCMFHDLLSTKWVDYVEEPMKYQALRPHIFSVGGWVGGSVGEVGVEDWGGVVGSGWVGDVVGSGWGDVLGVGGCGSGGGDGVGG